MIKKLLATTLAVLALSTSAFADRPLVTETPDTVPVGKVQVELGTTYTRLGSKITTGEAVVTTGINEKTEVAILTNYLYVRDRSSGLLDPAVRVKYKFNPNTAILVGTSVPVGANVYTTNYQPGVALAYKKDLTNRVNLLANVGYINTDITGDREHTGVGSVAVTTPTKYGTAFLETYGFTNRKMRDLGAVSVGLSKNVSNDLKLDGRVGRTIGSRNEPNYFVGVGLTLTR